MANFTIITDAETVNNTYNVHQIDLDTMLERGQCEPEDEIVFQVDGDHVECRFTNGGHLIDPGNYPELAKALKENQELLSV